MTNTWLEDTFGLGGRTAVVTGGTRGIGYMIAEGLLRAGADVVICARDAEACARAQESLAAFGKVTAFPANLSTEAGCADLAGLVAAAGPKLDVLVNNAGAAWGGPIEDYPEAGWDKVMDLNVKAVFMLTKHLLPQLQAAASAERSARVINTGSVDGLVVPGAPNFAYSASKAAVHHLTRVLAKTLADRHILVNAIAPGPFESKMMQFMLENFQEQIEKGVAVGRIGRPLDMAAAAVYLASAASEYVTGAVLPVDGGLSTTVGAGLSLD